MLLDQSLYIYIYISSTETHSTPLHSVFVVVAGSVSPTQILTLESTPALRPTARHTSALITVINIRGSHQESPASVLRANAFDVRALDGRGGGDPPKPRPKLCQLLTLAGVMMCFSQIDDSGKEAKPKLQNSTIYVQYVPCVL